MANHERDSRELPAFLAGAWGRAAAGAVILARTLFFYVAGVFWVGLLAYLLVTPVALVERLFRRRGTPLALTVLYRCLWITDIWYRRVAEMRIDDRERAPEGSVVVICNHHSFFDIYLLFHVFPRIQMSARKTLYGIPFLGWAMALLGHFPHDVIDPAAALDAAADRLRLGRYVGFFPEGTRAPSGTVLPFKSGAFRVAQTTVQRVQPCVVVGTDRVWPKHAFWVRRLGPVALKVLPPVDVPASLGRRELFALIEQVRERMSREHETMERALFDAGQRPIPSDAAAAN